MFRVRMVSSSRRCSEEHHEILSKTSLFAMIFASQIDFDESFAIDRHDLFAPHRAIE